MNIPILFLPSLRARVGSSLPELILGVRFIYQPISLGVYVLTRVLDNMFAPKEYPNVAEKKLAYLARFMPGKNS